MSNVNEVTLIGRLGQDPRGFEANGNPGTNLSIATTDRWTDKQTGERKEKTAWHSIVAWGRLGEICAKHLAKGSLVYVKGKLNYKEQEKDGVKRIFPEIVASNVQFLGPKPEPSFDDSDSIPF